MSSPTDEVTLSPVPLSLTVSPPPLPAGQSSRDLKIHSAPVLCLRRLLLLPLSSSSSSSTEPSRAGPSDDPPTGGAVPTPSVAHYLPTSLTVRDPL